MSTTWNDLMSRILDPNATFDFLDMEPISDSNFNTVLLYAYEKMQRVAVGIEQVTLDQALYRGSLLSEFRSIESHIVNILCNLHYAMVHQDLIPTASVTKEIMGAEYRDLDGTLARAHRDSIIMKKYNEAIDDLKVKFKQFTEMK
ncbi:hypothetical protein Pcinc_039070 [Petrolisthes cinctipes]|uniref:Uncharacterized protein n=1 Tax=Petrolisthes cinctipes TaxID=88211 RepID=A0AAE1EJE5_PETCI|nr:hypothetical protein Pcinc_039070 [Petrolisthes cinctipes]